MLPLYLNLLIVFLVIITNILFHLGCQGSQFIFNAGVGLTRNCPYVNQHFGIARHDVELWCSAYGSTDYRWGKAWPT